MLNSHPKGQTETYVQKFNFMFCHDPVAYISRLDLQLKVSVIKLLDASTLVGRWGAKQIRLLRNILLS